MYIISKKESIKAKIENKRYVKVKFSFLLFISAVIAEKKATRARILPKMKSAKRALTIDVTAYP